jgi:hypothetical protein
LWTAGLAFSLKQALKTTQPDRQTRPADCLDQANLSPSKAI